MNVQPRKTAVRSRRIHSLSAAGISDSGVQPVVEAIAIGVISDAASVQRALSVVINAVAAGTLDPARARVLLYGLQIAATNAHRLAASAKSNEVAPDIEQAATNVEPAVVAALQQPQAVLSEDDAKQDQAVAVNHSEDISTSTVDETPAQPDDSQSRGDLPPVCFSSAYDYKNRNSFREHMLRRQAQAAALRSNASATMSS